MNLIFLLVTSLVFSQAKILIEEGDADGPTNEINISSQILDLSLETNVVRIAGSGQIPEYFNETLFSKSFKQVLEDRQTLTCQVSKRNSFACYRCEQKDDRFHYVFYFSDMDASGCKISSYQIQLPEAPAYEKEVLRYMKLQNLEVENDKLQIPSVFEKEKYQIYIERLTDKYLLRFESNDFLSKLAEQERGANYLLEQIKVLWPKYTEITEQYINEIGVSFSEKINLNEPKKFKVENDNFFLLEFDALKLELDKLSDKEEKACKILNHRELLDYPHKEEILKDVKVKSHWSEVFTETLNDTVCGNYYAMTKLRQHLLSGKFCTKDTASPILSDIESLEKLRLNQIEKDMLRLYELVLQVRTASAETYLKNIEDKPLRLSGFEKYVEFKRGGGLDITNCN